MASSTTECAGGRHRQRPCLHHGARGHDGGHGGGACVHGSAALCDAEGLAKCFPPLSRPIGSKARKDAMVGGDS